MLNELVRRMSAGKPDRRGAERLRKRFPIAWLRDGTLVPALGLEISEKGVLFTRRRRPRAPASTWRWTSASAASGPA